MKFPRKAKRRTNRLCLQYSISCRRLFLGRFLFLLFLGDDFKDTLVDAHAVVFLFKRYPADKRSSAVFAAEFGGKVLVVKLPLLYSSNGLSALVAAEAQISFIDFRRIEVSDEVIFEGHALIKRFLVRAQHKARERKSV